MLRRPVDLTVNQQIVHARGRPYLDAPNTAAGHAPSPWTPATSTVLREHQRRQRLLLRHRHLMETGRASVTAFDRPVGLDWL